MSLYNLMHGVNAGAVVLFSPFLPRRADNFPRFRNIFTDADDTEINGDLYVYTRMGGGNSECWEDAQDGCQCLACDADQLIRHPRCIHVYDDDFDSTYRTFVFNVADEDRPDFERVLTGCLTGLSRGYKERLKDMFPTEGKPQEFADFIKTITGD